MRAVGFAAGLLYGLLLGGGALVMLMSGEGAFLYYLLGISPFLAGPFIWPIVGALLPVARTRTAFLVVLALLAAHYTGAALLIASYGAEAFAGMADTPIQLHLLALVIYLGGQALVWTVLVWRFRRAGRLIEARRPSALQAAAAVGFAAAAMAVVSVALPTPLGERQQQRMEAAAGVPLQDVALAMDEAREVGNDRPTLVVEVEAVEPAAAAETRPGVVTAPLPEGGSARATLALGEQPAAASPIVVVERADGPDDARQLTVPGPGNEVAGHPIGLAVDPAGRVHLMVVHADPFVYPRLELYWLIGSLETGRWEELWLVGRDANRASRVVLEAMGAGAAIHLMWSERQMDAEGGGLFHLQRSASGFSAPLRVLARAPDELALAPGPEEGDLWVAYTDGPEVFLLLRHLDGRWSEAVRVGAADARIRSLTVTRAGRAVEVQASGPSPAAWRVLMAHGST